jgi:DNA-binding phage protein
MLDTDYSSLFRALRPNANPKLRTMEKWAKILRIRVRDMIEERKKR